MSASEEMKQTKEQLKDIIGGWALRALLGGRPLQIWRNSTPHNWWVDSADGHNNLWHSDEYDCRRPDLRLFDNIKNNGKVIQYWGSDSGLPRHSFYVLKPKIIKDWLSQQEE